MRRFSFSCLVNLIASPAIGIYTRLGSVIWLNFSPSPSLKSHPLRQELHQSTSRYINHKQLSTQDYQPPQSSKDFAMSHRGDRSSAKNQDVQNNSHQTQASSSAGTEHVKPRGSVNRTQNKSLKDKGRDGQQKKEQSLPSTPSTTRSIRSTFWTTSSPSSTPSPAGSRSTGSWLFSSMTTALDTTNSPTQQVEKDPYNFYDDDDSEKEIDYPSSCASDSARSRRSNTDRSEQCDGEQRDEPAYDYRGWRSGSFFRSPWR